jgi:hypothetical protein
MVPTAEGGEKPVGCRWSVGTDQPKNEKKLTFELVGVENQRHQIPKLPQGFGDAPYERDQKIGENKLVSGH